MSANEVVWFLDDDAEEEDAGVVLFLFVKAKYRRLGYHNIHYRNYNLDSYKLFKFIMYLPATWAAWAIAIW